MFLFHFEDFYVVQMFCGKYDLGGENQQPVNPKIFIHPEGVLCLIDKNQYRDCRHFNVDFALCNK